MKRTRILVAHGGELTQILEADSGSASGSASGKYRIRIIAPGHGSSGVYTPENLAASAGIFKAGTQMYFDHPSLSEEADRPERSVRDLAGKLLTDAEVGEDGSLYAECEVYPSFDQVIREKWNDIGVSINAWSESEIGPDGIVPPLTGVMSVDFVTKAGAGGALLEVLESQSLTSTEETESMTPEEFKAILAEALAPLMEAFPPKKKDDTEDPSAPADSAPASSDAPADPKSDEEDPKKKKESLEDALDVARALSESDLPAPAKDRVIEAVREGTSVKDAIEAEKKYIESVSVPAVGRIHESAGSDEEYVVGHFKTTK